MAKQTKAPTFRIILLSDGETYNLVEGCKILEVTEEGLRLLQDDHKAWNLPAGRIVSSEDLK